VTLDPVWRALEDWSVAQSIRGGPTLYPAVETVHLLGVALVLGTVATLDVRLLGASRRLPAGLLARHTLTIVWCAFAVAAVSGFLLFATRATAYADNTAMQLKAALLVLAGLNAAGFHVGSGRRMLRDPERWSPPAGARAVAGLSLVLWLMIAVAGRWIAYT
jgi:hypothetical protein